MKTKLFLAAGLLLAASAFEQNQVLAQKNGEASSFTSPQFTGIKGANTDGNSAVYAYLGENVNYSEAVNKFGVEGTSVFQFMVTDKGNISNAKVLNSVSPNIELEVLKVLKASSGMWKPALKNGYPVGTLQEISITFHSGNKDNQAVTNEFIARASVFYKKGNNELITRNNPAKAVKYFDRALKYMPYDIAILNSRGNAKYRLNDVNGAQKDWDRVSVLTQEKLNLKRNQAVAQNISE